MDMKEVMKQLLELRDELYFSEQITMNGVWKLNGLISKIQKETGIFEAEIGYTEPDPSTYFANENVCKFNHWVDCEKCDNCENCAWNPGNEYLREQRAKKAAQAYFEKKTEDEKV